MSEVALVTVNEIDQFKKLFATGIDSWIQAGTIYANCIKRNPKNKDVFCEKIPEISRAVWDRLEKIGTGALSPRLLLLPQNGFFLAKCSVSEQEKYLAEPIEVLLFNGDILKVKLSDLTYKQCQQVFAGDHVRSLAEQKAIIESGKTQIAIVNKITVGKKYKINNGTIHVLIPCEFTKKELTQILLQEL